MPLQFRLGRSFEYVARTALLLCLAVSIITSVVVFVILFKESYEFFKIVPLFDFLTGTEWQPLIEPKKFGVLPLVSGSLLIVVGSIVLALPVAILVAVYIHEFSENFFKKFFKPVLEILAGIPSVVYGYFALNFITPLLREVFPNIAVFNAASASIVLAIMILPMITSLTDDSFRSLPKSMKEGAYALGATPFEVISKILLPASATRIIAAVILAVSRALGETMAVTLAAGSSPSMSWNPFESIQTMTSYIVQVSLGDTPAGGPEYLSCFAVAFLLFLITFAMNTIGNMIIVKFEMRHA